jgi:hypothetical protein
MLCLHCSVSAPPKHAAMSANLPGDAYGHEPLRAVGASAGWSGDPIPVRGALRVEATVTFAKRVGRWLLNNRGAYCDDCIAKKLQLSRRQQANRASISLASVSCFYRDKGTCSVCGAEKKVTAAV